MSFNGELREVCKAYGTVKANQGVDLLVRAGTVHALVGENGAGKSTAMKILFGLEKPDSGQIRYGDEPVGADWSPQVAFARGIGMVHQHFMLAVNETVHDNLVLGIESTRGLGLFRDREKERAELEALMESTGLHLPLKKKISELPIGLQSRCEILKVLYRKARFLILDEPTAVLTPQEIESFLQTLKHLKGQGLTILLVTHKLREVMEVADEVTVLRAGKTVGRLKTSETSAAELSDQMVGRHVQLPRVGDHNAPRAASPVARLKTPKFELELFPGQITGIAGVEGNGQEELVRCLIEPSAQGELSLELFQEDASSLTTEQLRRKPVGVIPADRHREGLVLDFTLVENLRLGRKQASSGDLDYFGRTTDEELSQLREFDVRPPLPELTASALSGGNQQKLIFARELSGLPTRALVLAIHPTRGVDVGAIEFIHNRLLDVARAGGAVLLLSSELEELMALSHRIGVCYQGSIVRWFNDQPYDEKSIGRAMLTGASA